MTTKETIFNELINMGIASSAEATDLLIALYPHLSRSDQADIITMLREYYDN